MEHALADVTKAEHAAQTEIVRRQLADMAVRPRWKNNKKRNGMGLDRTGGVTGWVGALFHSCLVLALVIAGVRLLL